MWGKQSSERSEKNVFLYSHVYRYQKIGGKKREKQFFQKHTISASKKCLEKIVGKKCEKRFFIFTRKSWPKNGGNKTRETIFPATH